MKDRAVAAVGIFASAGIVISLSVLSASVQPQSDNLKYGFFASVGSTIDALPPSGAGLPVSPAPAAPKAPSADAYLGGTKASGRVAELYIKVAENVYLASNQAPEHLRKRAERWVDIEFPDLLAGEIGSARGMLNQSQMEIEVEVGDVVQIKFAHKDNPRYFPVNEVTRVTAVVAKKHEMLARDFERRILARSAPNALPPGWLARAQAAAPAWNPAPRTTTADARP